MREFVHGLRDFISDCEGLLSCGLGAFFVCWVLGMGGRCRTYPSFVRAYGGAGFCESRAFGAWWLRPDGRGDRYVCMPFEMILRTRRHICCGGGEARAEASAIDCAVGVD